MEGGWRVGGGWEEGGRRVGGGWEEGGEACEEVARRQRGGLWRLEEPVKRLGSGWEEGIFFCQGGVVRRAKALGNSLGGGCCELCEVLYVCSNLYSPPLAQAPGKSGK